MTEKKRPTAQVPVGRAEDDVFELDEAEPQEEWTYFKFRIPGDDEVYTVPHMQFLSVDLVDRVNTEGIPAVLELMGTSSAAVRKLNGKQLNQLMTRWQSESKVTLGE